MKVVDFNLIIPDASPRVTAEYNSEALVAGCRSFQVPVWHYVAYSKFYPKHMCAWNINAYSPVMQPHFGYCAYIYF